MDSIKDLLSKKADDIDDSGVVGDLQLIQRELDRLYENQAKVKSIDEGGVATITTRSSSIASELRLQQTQILETLNGSSKSKINQLKIRIQ